MDHEQTNREPSTSGRTLKHQDSSTHHTLQTLTFPDESRADRLGLYARWPGGHISLANTAGEMRVYAGSTVDFSTYFNAFSHQKWLHLTSITDVHLAITGEGRVRVEVSVMNRTAAALVIAREEITLGDRPSIVDLPDLSTLPGTMIFFTITALDADALLTGAQWVTAQQPKRAVNLAVVITTFRREEAARTAMERFATVTIPECPNGTIHLYVIDNGKTIQPIEHEGLITLIPNNNLGGAGGFARGLIEATQSSHYTHVLFMDDDASCEPEAVWRAIAILSYCLDPRASVAGAMLLSERPTIQYEKGALLLPDGGKHGVFHALNHHWDLSDAAAVADNDHPDISNYGAWWFFAFPLSAISKFPFPFFVRGDDIDFSLSNNLPIVTMNGVATWCDNFGYKLTPNVEYLATRSYMALGLMHRDIGAARQALRHALRDAMTLGLRFDYASMAAILDGLEHALKGPQFFAENPAPIDQIRKVNGARETAPMTAEDFQFLTEVRGLRGIKRFLGKLSLGGHFGPTPRRKQIPHTRIAWEVPRWALSRVNRAAYGKGSELQIYSRDSEKMRSLLGRWIRLYFTPVSKLKSIAKIYRERADLYRSREYWNSQFARNN